ncbi:putative spermatogenesis-associated protein 31D3 [Octodon degus]|uniref:Spermatogenesis-associated protein 31D3 n=1 Tax=Octodon degus TaxID=10160 RepID=A0A6P6F2G7_OCTDE|nr:putative spermatogenesis-associated protein 31D3 [Octodon degus]
MEPWLSCGSSLLALDPSGTLLNAAVLLLLLLCYLWLKPFLPTFWDRSDIPKLQHRSRRRRRSTTLKGWRASLRERQEGRKLHSLLKSPLGQLPDTTHFRQLLCPDPFCDVCNTTTAKVSRMLSQAPLEDAAYAVTNLTSTDSDSSSTQTYTSSAVLPGHSVPAHAPEPSLPPPSILSPSLITCLVDSPSPVLLGDFQQVEHPSPLDSKSPVDCFPPESLASPCSLLCHTQKAKPGLQPRSTSPVSYSPGGFSTNHLHTMEVSLQGQTEIYLVEPGNLKILRPDSWALLERQIKKRGDLLLGKGKGKQTESFLRQHQPDSPVKISQKRSESAAGQQDSACSLPIWSSEGKPEGLPTQVKPLGAQSLEDHLEQKHRQFFWGLPSLHSESLNPIVPASGDCSSIFICFNTISSTSKACEYPNPPHPSPPPLPHTQPQPLPQTLPQSHSPNTLPVKIQAQCLSLPPCLLPSPECQPRSCGVYFHGSQGEIQSLTPAEIEQLEVNVLQKVQESVWGLPSVVRRSREDFCPPAPKLSLISQASKAHMPVSILPGDFPCSSELRKKLEHHLRKRLVQHRWGLPRRVLESLSMMQPRSVVPQASVTKESYGLSWISLYKGQSSKDLSQFETMHETNSETLPLEEAVGKNQGHSLVSGPQNLSAQDTITHDAQGSYSEKALESQAEKNSGVSSMRVNQKQLEKTLKVHLSKKFEEIHEGQIPDAVNKSWHSVNLTLPLPQKSSSHIKGRGEAPLLSKGSHLDTSQDISFLSSSKQQMMEEHITTFRRRMMWGLPHKVQESIEISNIKEDRYPALSHSESPSSGTCLSDLNSKMGVCKTLRRSSHASEAHEVETNLDVGLPHPATSQVGMAGLGTRRQSPQTYTDHKLAENMQTGEDGPQVSMLPRHSSTDMVDQKQTLQDKRCHPEPPIGQAGAASDVSDMRISSCSAKERLQSHVTMQLEYLPMCDESRDTFNAKKLKFLQSQTSNISITSKSGANLRKAVKTSKTETPLITKRPLPRTAVPQDVKSSKLKNQLLNELRFKIESRKKSQPQGLPANAFPASKNLQNRTLFHHDHSASRGNVVASRVMHACLDITTSHLEQRHKPWVPKQVLHKHQDQKFSPEAERECPLILKARDFGGGDAGMDIYHRRSCPDQDRVLEKARGGKFSPPVSPRGQPHPEELFRDKMKHFFQWIFPSVKHTGQESPIESSSSESSVQRRGPGRGRTGLIQNTKDQKTATRFEKVLH